MDSQGKQFSIVACMFTIIFLVVVNFITPSDFPWSIFPSFALIWWPIAICFKKSTLKVFSIIGSITVIVSLIIINLLTTPKEIWFIGPAYAVLWWPLSVFFAKKYRKTYSVICSLLILFFLLITNYIETPEYPWILFTIVPLIIWPICTLLGKKVAIPSVALSCSTVFILYYVLLNIFFAPGFPWSIFPSFALLWWPLAAFGAKYKKIMTFTVLGTIFICTFFIVLNYITTPDNIWFVYPVFAVLWWPLSIYFFRYKRI